jgi:hypothetical protein
VCVCVCVCVCVYVLLFAGSRSSRASLTCQPCQTIQRLQQDLSEAAARHAGELRRRESEHATAVAGLRDTVRLAGKEPYFGRLRL